MIKNIIFDFGQVLIRYDPKKMVRDVTNSETAVEAITPVLFDRLYWDRLDLGTIEDEELLSAVEKRLPEEYRPLARAAYHKWYARCPIIEGMEELIGELKEKGFALYLLSNISKELREEYKTIPHLARLFSRFDGLVFSGAVGMIKPHPEIYHHLLSTYGLNASESLFIDDSEKNLKGAERVGITPVLFEGTAEKLRLALQNYVNFL